MEFFGFDTEEQLEFERTRYLNGLRTYNKSYLYFHLIEKESGKIIGWCGYHTWYLDHDRAEIGYGLRTDTVKRKGYMSEAITAVLDYGFSQMNLHRIEAMASPSNDASIRVLEGNGFVREGLLKQHYFINDVYEDSAIYALIRKE